MFTSHTLDLDGIRLHADSGPPAGEPLILLHGVSRSGRDLAPLFPAVTQRWRALAVDQRGHGRSARAKSYFVRDYAVDLVQLLSQPAFHPAVVYGHSLGALVAVCAAASAPERVRALILEDPPAERLLADIERTPYFPLFSAMQRLAGSKLAVDELARQLAEIRLPAAQGEVRLGDLRDGVSLRFMARCLQDVDPAVYEPLLAGRWLEGIDFQQQLRAVRCPVLLLSGDDKAGGMLGRAAAEAIVQQLSDVVHLSHPGVGHLIHWQDTEVCLRHLLGFLESL